MMVFKVLVIFLITVQSTFAFWGGLLRAAPQDLSRLDLKIIEIIYSEDISSHKMVRINAGENIGLKVGDLFTVYRKERDPYGIKTIEIGKIKVAELNKDQSFGIIVEEKTELSLTVYPKFPMVMAGDSLQVHVPEIQLTQVISPIITLAYKDLFIDPLDHPHSYELSEAGKKLLRQSFSEFAGMLSGNMVVEAYTDDFGSSASNQLESTQRAAIIRQFAINALGFDGERLTAIGFGENNQLDQNYTPDYRSQNRRIVLKIIPVNNLGF